MLDNDFHTLCVMTATIRAGRAGKTSEAWAVALEEAVSGYAMICKNRHEIAKITALQVATPDSELPDSPIDSH